MKLKLLFFLLLASLSLKAQKAYKIPVNKRVIVNFQNEVVYADILLTKNKLKPDDNLFYFWFSANDIKRTRGGFDGKLLHGDYRAFYLNKNLKEKGSFKYGLKDKEWKSWYMNGELKEVTRWKNGKLNGKYRLYDSTGVLVESGYYKYGLFHGKVFKYNADGTTSKEKYVKGKLKKVRGSKGSFSFFKKLRGNKKNRLSKGEVQKGKSNEVVDDKNTPDNPNAEKNKKKKAKKEKKPKKEKKVKDKDKEQKPSKSKTKKDKDKNDKS